MPWDGVRPSRSYDLRNAEPVQHAADTGGPAQSAGGQDGENSDGRDRGQGNHVVDRRAEQQPAAGPDGAQCVEHAQSVPASGGGGAGQIVDHLCAGQFGERGAG
jgi:hypothetical protein